MRRLFLLLSSVLGVGLGVGLPFAPVSWIPAGAASGGAGSALLLEAGGNLELVDDTSALLIEG